MKFPKKLRNHENKPYPDVMYRKSWLQVVLRKGVPKKKPTWCSHREMSTIKTRYQNGTSCEHALKKCQKTSSPTLICVNWWGQWGEPAASVSASCLQIFGEMAAGERWRRRRRQRWSLSWRTRFEPRVSFATHWWSRLRRTVPKSRGPKYLKTKCLKCEFM